jgi:hypothetical protein
MNIFNREKNPSGNSDKADQKEATEINKEYDEKWEALRKDIQELSRGMMGLKMGMDEETAKQKIKDFVAEELDHTSFFS